MRIVNDILVSQDQTTECYICNKFPDPFAQCSECKTFFCENEIRDYHKENNRCPTEDCPGGAIIQVDLPDYKVHECPMSKCEKSC